MTQIPLGKPVQNAELMLLIVTVEKQTEILVQ
jgi:hypothetical protein